MIIIRFVEDYSKPVRKYKITHDPLPRKRTPSTVYTTLEIGVVLVKWMLWHIFQPQSITIDSFTHDRFIVSQNLHPRIREKCEQTITFKA